MAERRMQALMVQLDSMTTTVNILSTQIAVMGEREKQMVQDIMEMKNSIEVMREAFARGRGAIYVLTIVSSLAAAMLGFWDKIPKPWGH